MSSIKKKFSRQKLITSAKGIDLRNRRYIVVEPIEELPEQDVTVVYDSHLDKEMRRARYDYDLYWDSIPNMVEYDYDFIISTARKRNNEGHLIRNLKKVIVSHIGGIKVKK